MNTSMLPRFAPTSERILSGVKIKSMGVSGFLGNTHAFVLSIQLGHTIGAKYIYGTS